MSNQENDQGGDFGLIRSFDIDHGELDGLTPQLCFVLGYELAQIDELLKKPEGFSKMVHAENRERIEKYAKGLGRKFTFTWPHTDVSEAWLYLEVQPR